MSMHRDRIAAELQHRQRYQKHITVMMLKEENSSGYNGTMRLKCYKEMHDTIDQQLKVLDKISKFLNTLSVGVGVDGDDGNMYNFMDTNTDDCRDEQNEETVREAALDDEFIELISACTGQPSEAVKCHICREMGLPCPNQCCLFPMRFSPRSARNGRNLNVNNGANFIEFVINLKII